MREIPPQNDDPGSTLSAVPFNSLANENENEIITSGQALDASSDFQKSVAMANYAAVSNSYIDSGVANSYVLAANAPFLTPDLYRSGMSIRFLVGATNTGASVVAVGLLGTTPFKKDNGVNELSSGDLVAGREVWGTFSTAAGGFFNLVAFLQQSLVSLFPGAIMPWQRPAPDTPIPVGFALCDGTNGTPDLRAKFVVGEGVGFTFGQVGGASSVTTSTEGNHVHVIANAGGHTHTVTVDGHVLTIAEMPAHDHAIIGDNTTGGANQHVVIDSTFTGANDVTAQTGGGGAHIHTGSAASAGVHLHTESTDGDHTHTAATLPPFHTLVYLMKL